MFRSKKKTPVEQARDDLQKQLRVVNKQAKETRKEFVKRLNHTADDLRDGFNHLFNREEQKQINRIAKDLETIAQNVEQQAEKGLHDITEDAQEHVWRTVIVSVIVGLVVGLLLKELFD